MVPATLVALFVNVERRIRPERLLAVVGGVQLRGALVGVVGLAVEPSVGTAAVVTTFVAAGVIAGAGALARPTHSAPRPGTG